MKVEHAKRLDELDHRSLALWAAVCAERVLPCFEENCPEDDRPRKAIEAGRAWTRGEIACSEARAAAVAAHAAARATNHVAARAAARAAGHAAATAHVAGHARHAAAYAVKAATAAGTAPATERDWQRRRLPEHLHPAKISKASRFHPPRLGQRAPVKLMRRRKTNPRISRIAAN